MGCKPSLPAIDFALIFEGHCDGYIKARMKALGLDNTNTHLVDDLHTAVRNPALLILVGPGCSHHHAAKVNAIFDQTAIKHDARTELRFGIVNPGNHFEYVCAKRKRGSGVLRCAGCSWFR